VERFLLMQAIIPLCSLVAYLANACKCLQMSVIQIALLCGRRKSSCHDQEIISFYHRCMYAQALFYKLHHPVCCIISQIDLCVCFLDVNMQYLHQCKTCWQEDPRLPVKSWSNNQFGGNINDTQMAY